ncbi:MAG: Ig-like domain-containing protein [Myxococcales bacterium]
MRRVALTTLTALSALVLFGCDKPAYIDLEPKAYTFKRVGEDLWWKAKVRTKNNKFIQTKTVVWTSADPKVVSVDAKGRAKAVGPGQTTISAECEGIKSEAVVDVQGVGKIVVEPAEGLVLDARGEGKPIKVTVFDLAGHPISDRAPQYRCQNEDICRVFPGPLVNGVDSGETTLEVSCEGQKVSIPIKVNPTEEERIAKGIDVDKPAKPAKKK